MIKFVTVIILFASVSGRHVLHKKHSQLEALADFILQHEHGRNDKRIGDLIAKEFFRNADIDSSGNFDLFKDLTSTTSSIQTTVTMETAMPTAEATMPTTETPTTFPHTQPVTFGQEVTSTGSTLETTASQPNLKGYQELLEMVKKLGDAEIESEILIAQIRKVVNTLLKRVSELQLKVKKLEKQRQSFPLGLLLNLLSKKN